MLRCGVICSNFLLLLIKRPVAQMQNIVLFIPSYKPKIYSQKKTHSATDNAQYASLKKNYTDKNTIIMVVHKERGNLCCEHSIFMLNHMSYEILLTLDFQFQLLAHLSLRVPKLFFYWMEFCPMIFDILIDIEHVQYQWKMLRFETWTKKTGLECSDFLRKCFEIGWYCIF
jgi:hypothetical protein